MGRIRQALDSWHLRKVQDRWTTAADDAAEADTFTLRSLRAEARTMRRQIDRVIHEADHRLTLPVLGAALPRAPLGSDWVWRGDAWRGPLPQPGAVASETRTAISDDLALYHDCPLAEVSVRQSRNGDDSHRAPYGLGIEVFGFRGSFLSLAINLPDEAVQGLKVRHLIRVDAIVEADRPVRAFARLNVKHGPNIAQMVSELPLTAAGGSLAEFDLAYAGLDDTRIERAWLDLIFNDAAHSQIQLRDVVVSRRPRAEL
jgi:hypothetical protein